MLTLALLPLELILAGLLVAAQFTNECHNNLNKLNNKQGQSPCTVREQLQQACISNEFLSLRNCTCNTVSFNIWAGCALCSGDEALPWAIWASQYTCDPTPTQSDLPPTLQIDNVVVPKWAYQQLTSQLEFDVVGAVDDSNPSNAGMSRGAQIAVPIVVAVCVALIVFLVTWIYFQKRARMSFSPPPEGGLLSYPRRWIYELRLWSNGLHPSNRDPQDDNMQLLHAPPMQETHEFGMARPLHHAGGASTTSLLPQIDFPDVRVPTFVERFIKFKDGIRKSKGYKAKYVSPISPDESFRIDGSEASPAPNKELFNAIPDSRRQPHGAVPLNSHERREDLEAARDASQQQQQQQQQQVATDSGPQSRSENVMGEVLVISRDGNDFFIDDSATSGSSRTPLSTRQPSTAYSSSRPAITPTTATTAGASSWLHAHRRTNTSSTASGAYPHQLRHDPDLRSAEAQAQSQGWAALFPLPPQTFNSETRGR